MYGPTLALLSTAYGLLLALLAACSSPSGDGSPPETSIVASVDRVYRFDAAGSLPLVDRSELPVAPGAVTARWYTFRGWYVVLFDGLDLEATGPVCLRTSIFNRGTSQLEHAFNSATAEGGCEGAGARVFAPPARGAAGARVCDGLVSYVTDIPAELGGTLFASITVFPGDGTGLEVSGRVESTIGPPGEIGESRLDCGPLPEARVVRLPSPTAEPAVPTPVPASKGDVAAAHRVPPPAPTKPERCTPAEEGELQDVTDTEASPYFVHHPAPDNPNAATVIFLAGGSGRRASAQRVWDNIFADAPPSEAFRVAIPYSLDADFIDEATRTLAIVNEVLWCYGGDPAKVHLAGASNGGLAAFALMMKRPELFATLLGAPGAFPVQDPSTVEAAVWAHALAGRAVFNGVGANDDNWKAEVIATHNALAAAGVESAFVEFPDQGHVLTAAFDASVFFDFWSSH